jgi:hypothetical protein
MTPLLIGLGIVGDFLVLLCSKFGRVGIISREKHSAWRRLTDNGKRSQADSFGKRRSMLAASRGKFEVVGLTKLQVCYFVGDTPLLISTVVLQI